MHQREVTTSEVVLFEVDYLAVFGDTLTLKVTATHRARPSVVRSWYASCERAAYKASHPWRTVNLAGKMAKLMHWQTVWKYRRHWHSQAEITNELKLASCERDHINDLRETD